MDGQTVAADPMSLPKRYGVYLRDCTCGWKTANKRPNIVCEKCGKTGTNPSGSTEEFREDVACVIATCADQRIDAVWQIALRQGYAVYQMSARRYVVLRVNGTRTVKFKDGQHRCYLDTSPVYGPCNYQEAMKFVRSKVKDDLPEYLRK